MFGVDFSEVVLIFGLALVVLGPQRLPKVAATIGRWVGRARTMARQFREQLEQEANTIRQDVNPHLNDIVNPPPPAATAAAAPAAPVDPAAAQSVPTPTPSLTPEPAAATAQSASATPEPSTPDSPAPAPPATTAPVTATPTAAEAHGRGI